MAFPTKEQLSRNAEDFMAAVRSRRAVVSEQDARLAARNTKIRVERNFMDTIICP